MKKILSMAVALASLMTLLSGCGKDELSTDQYVRDGVALNVYGPQPVTRGGQLRFLGSNLDRVVQVIIPGVDPITDIEVVQAGVPSEIRITVPKDGPEPGLVSLVTSDGQTLTTKTELTYSEPIEFEGFTPSSARPGDVITITGDYLNLIQEVIFSDEVLVSETDFESHTRYEIRVKVPEAAQTGVIGLGDIDMTLPENEGLFANVITSEEELTVVLPTVTDVAPLDMRPGDEVTVTGTLLNCISSVRFAGADEIAAEDFVSRSATEIVVTVPDAAHDGEVVCVAASGIEIPTGKSVTIDLPSVTGVTATSRFKAGLTVMITGSDLDMVTGVTFAGDAPAEFTFSDRTGSITATIPAEATDGVITLTTAAEKSVETQAVTLVKPVITGFGAAEVMAGEDFTVIGTDLDLVTGVTLNGAECEFTADSDMLLTVSTVLTSSTGTVTVTAANGDSADSPSELIVNHDSITIVTDITASAAPGGTVTMTGSSFNMIESITLGDVKVTEYLSRSDGEIVFVVPDTAAPGVYFPHFVLTTGEEEDSALSFEVLGAERTIWEGNILISWGDGGRVSIPASGFEGCTEGMTINFYFEQTTETWSQIQFNYGNWSALIFPEVGAQTFAPTENSAGWGWTFGSRCLTCTLTQEILDGISANHGEFEGVDCGIIIQGDGGILFTKVTVK